MARVPFFVATPLRYSADVASAYSSMLARYAELLRALAGDEDHEGHDAAPPAAARPVAATATQARSGGAQPPSPAGGPAEPARDADEEHTVGRRAAERKEPTPEPARGSSAASASRRASSPKMARKVRERKTRATTIDTVEASGGSGRGGTPAAPAENTPKRRARAGQGREPAPMGSQDDSAS